MPESELIEGKTQVTVTAPNPAPGSPPPANAPAGEPKRRAWMTPLILRVAIILMALALVVLFTVDWDRWISSSPQQTTDNAYLQADLTPIAAKVSGYVRQVDIQDYQRVKEGDPLFEIVDDDYRAQVAAAAADVEGARAAIANIENQRALQQTLIRQARATIDATQADLDRFVAESKRQNSLLKQGLAGTAQHVEEATADAKHAQATLEINKAQLDQQQRQVAVLDTQEQQAQATLKAKAAALDLAQINLGYTRIVAPVSGEVGQRQVKPGQYVNIGTQLISIVPLPHIWVIANFKETQMTRIRAGQSATVTVDAFPDARLTGHVESWSPASGAQFSLLPPDNATGNFTKVVQRIPVKIVLDLDQPVADLLRPGMSVIATVDTTSQAETTKADATKADAAKTGTTKAAESTAK